MNAIAGRRLLSQQIEHSRFKTPAELVAWMGAVQAQDYLGGLWTLGSRLPGTTDSDIEQALAGGEIFRTWALRGTIHFVAAADIRWMLALQAPRQIARNARRYRELELDEETMQKSNDILVGALDKRELTRRQLLAILGENGISTKGQRAPFLLQRASLEGLICQGVTKRNDPTYTLLREPEATLSAAEAAGELAKRYFLSHGPATIRDFIWWSGLTAAAARDGLEAASSRLTRETIAGETYWSDPDLTEDTGERAHILSSYDEYLVSYRNRDAMIDPEHRNLTLIGTPTVIVDGRVAGTWRRVLKANAVIVTTSLFRTLPDRKAVEQAVEAYGRFLVKEVEWQQ